MSVTDVGLPGIDAAAVTRWLADHVGDLRPPVTFSLIGAGLSNLTYRLIDAAGATLVLRRPPTGGVLQSAHDMSREWRFLSALAPTGVPVAAPVAYCDDPSVTGAEFYLMGHIDGMVLTDAAAAEALPVEARRTAGFAVADTLAGLHAVDFAAVGLGDLARRGSYVVRQLRRWHQHVHQSGSSQVAVLDRVHAALAAHIPEQVTGIVHGDYKAANVAFDPGGRLVAVFDWELATLGDPLADLGWLISTWAEPGDTVAPTAVTPTAAPGFPNRAEMLDRYARVSGRDLSGVGYYEAFARWRAACIAAGVEARYRAGLIATGHAGVETYLRNQVAQGEVALEALTGLGLA